MKIVLLNSGGKDSLAAVMTLRKTRGYEIYSLFVRLGHANDDRAAAMAKKIADKYCDSHTELAIPGLIPSPTKNGTQFGFPHQALLLHAYAAAWAGCRGIYAVASGQNGARELREGIRAAFEGVRSLREPPVLLTPVWGIGPDRTFEIINNDPLWRETVTCNHEPACNKCRKCLLRAEWEAK